MIELLSFTIDVRSTLKSNRFQIKNKYCVFPKVVGENYPCEAPKGRRVVPPKED